MRDGLGRRVGHQRQSTGKRIRLTARDWLWLRVLHAHGPLSTSVLLAFAAGERVSRKRQQERLTDLFHEENTAHGGSYLDRPMQQYATLNAGFNETVHQLATAGARALREAGQWHDRTVHRGHWPHRFMVASITASIELATLGRSDLSYLPQHALLDRAKADLACPVQTQDPTSGQLVTKKLQPDALFGLTYHAPDGDAYRVFALEADRATEPANSGDWNRKSFQRHLAQYRAYVADGAYREHLKLFAAPLLVLNVVPDEQRLSLMVRQTERQLGSCSYQLFQTFPAFAQHWKPPKPNHALLGKAWKRAGEGPFRIDEP